MRRRGLPKHVSEFLDRYGTPRVRARRKGFPTHYFKARPGTEAFEAEYRAWRDGQSQEGAGRSRTIAGSVSDLISRYYKSIAWANLSSSTQAARRNILERFRVEHGEKPVARIESRHIANIIAARSQTPAAGQNLLKILHQLMTLAIQCGMRKDDPSHGVKPVISRSDGFHSWTEDEIAAFERTHAVGSRARLAFALLLFTGQRRSDVIGMGWQHIREGRIHVRQRKTGNSLAVAVHPALKSILDVTPRAHLTFLVTAQGKPFSPAGFGNWFRDCVTAAGLPARCAAHGLRKAAARRLAEAGCSASQIAAVTGHRSLREVERYTAAASQMAMADAAIAAVARSEQEQKLANSDDRLAKTGDK